MAAFTHRYDAERDLDVVEGPGLDLAVRRRGAEAVSLAWKDPVRGPVGLLWRDGRDDDPERFWKSHAPILFPIVGGLHGHASRCTTGEAVRFPGLHGFVRKRDLALVQAGPDGDGFTLRYRLLPDAGTREMYPWDFAFEAAYTLRERRLGVALSVTNADGRAMPFQVGWHPGFAQPLVPGAGEKAACVLEIPAGIDRLGNDANCFLDGTRWPVPGGPFPRTEKELDATYMLDASAVAPEDRAVTLRDPDGGLALRVAFPGFPHLGLWSDADAPFLCIEPWQGMDDSVVQEPFDRKFGAVMLAPGATEVRTASVEVL
jgi:galactose mutarotase-like enzyme